MRKVAVFCLFIIVLLLILSVIIKQNFNLEHDLTEDHLSINNKKYKFYAQVPEKTNDKALFIILHGSNANARSIINYTQFDKFAKQNQLLVVFPEKSGLFDWDLSETSDDIKFINKLIEHMVTKYEIDAQQIYITGYSSGGFMAERVACALGDKIAGIALIASMLKPELECKNFQAGKILLINGDKDPYFNWESILNSKKTWEEKHQQKVKLIQIFDGGHTWPGAASSLRIKTFLGKTGYNINANEKIGSLRKI